MSRCDSVPRRLDLRVEVEVHLDLDPIVGLVLRELHDSVGILPAILWDLRDRLGESRGRSNLLDELQHPAFGHILGLGLHHDQILPFSK